ncbi:hypothetical protein OKA05_24140 [Luteolibacter arcticus]|uniref:Cytochrome c n=1 Tax=Luteolibacter arcticus TaxID=1581411 RepID=A0ABT3GQA9_9BACT|nr:hypothetical protein [Luteolibacter arcticus]MCW1925670.1 hypothetical protein [Luteolibacter arcticus]
MNHPRAGVKGMLLLSSASALMLAALLQGEVPDSDAAKGKAKVTEAKPAAGGPELQPLPATEPLVELAPFMGELQRLTHKLALSADAGNSELARFYLYESLEQFKSIQEEVPEYRGQPVALLIDRMAKPAYDALEKASSKEGATAEDLRQPLNGVIAACNQCHVATQHGFIKITAGTGTNPFNQDFKP